MAMPLLLAACMGRTSFAESAGEMHLAVKVLPNVEVENVKCFDREDQVVFFPLSSATVIEDGVTLQPDEAAIITYAQDAAGKKTTLRIRPLLLDADVLNYNESDNSLEVGSFAIGQTTLDIPNNMNGADFVGRTCRFRVSCYGGLGLRQRLVVHDAMILETVEGKLIHAGDGMITILTSGNEAIEALYDDNTQIFNELLSPTVMIAYTYRNEEGQLEALSIWNTY